MKRNIDFKIKNLVFGFGGFLLVGLMVTDLFNPAQPVDAGLASNTALVEFKLKPSQAEIEKLKSIESVSRVERFDSFQSEYFERVYRVSFSGSFDSIRPVLLASQSVVSVEPSKRVELMSIIPSNEANLGSNDPLVGYQWALKLAGQVVLREIDDIHSERIQSAAAGPVMDIGISAIRSKLDSQMKRDVLVAVIDSGVDVGHPDLTNNIYRNTVECDAGKNPFKPTVDKDGNGYVGDCMGWNFTTKDPAGDNNVEDDLGHGTHVAGIIAAEIGNGIGVAGVSNRIKIIPIKVTSKRDNSALTDRVAKAILYAVKMKADVINFSLGWPISTDAQYLRQAFSEARKAGVVVVAAAGNNTSGAPVFPCSYEGVICVGASSLNGTVSNFSNYGGHVDVMAPGEQILSTYPTSLEPEQFSVKGYEIKNGTSQASPYVAAQAAVLKGLFSSISVDEIQARLLLSSKCLKWEEKYALSGTTDLTQALKVAARPAVYPVFKGLSQIPFQMTDRAFRFSVPIKNYWSASSQVVVSAELVSQVATLDQSTVNLGALGQGEVREVQLSGQISDVSGAREAMLKVSVSVDGSPVQVYQQQVVFTRLLVGDPSVKSYPIRLSGKPDASFNLFSIKSLRDNEAYPDYVYFSSLSTANANSITLKLVRWKNGVFVEEAPIILPDAKQLLFAWRVDLNGDGRPDYVIGSITQKGQTKGIQYTYLRDDLTAFFPGQMHLPVVVDGAVIDEDGVKSLAVVPLAAPGGTVTLAFTTKGRIPKEDLNPDPFAYEDNSERTRMYFYEPRLVSGQWKVVTRSFDNSAWEKKARERLHLPFRQLIGVSNLIPPTDTDVKAGQVRALVSVGESSLKQYLIMTISASQLLSHDFTLTDAKFSGQTFEGGDIRGSVSLDSEIPSWHAGAAIASFYSAVQGRLTVLASDDPSRIQSTQTVEAVRAQDHLLGFIQSFTKGNETIAFYQSQSQLIARTTAPGLDARDFAAIDRSSLIPGKVFNALFFPVTRGTGVSKDPAIYVDSTQLSSRRVYLWTIDKGHLVAPMRMNVEIPAGCRALAPRRFGERGEMSYVLLCPLGSDYELKTLTIE